MAESPPPGDIGRQLVRRNGEARSWREKLALVQDLLADEDRELTPGDLTDVAIYLRFLSTGGIPCEEDGSHYRPSHHARIATRIHERLARLDAPELAFMVRKIQACLPSTAEPFQRAEPLTRIRDIAHRNDIPQDLKREIKTTLQNKLHRCAGPEDLVTSAGLLERIIAPDSHYSGDFVEQFRIFHGELLEFFNAASLDDRLRAFASTAGDTVGEAVSAFLAAKHRSEPDTLRHLTRLRELLDAGGIEARLADIALEDFAFPLLSEEINRLDAGDWPRHLDTLALTLDNLGRIAPEETAAIASELRTWRAGFDPADRDALLRLKASVDRARRVAGEFSDVVLARFADRAGQLAPELGVDPRAATVFAEAEIRSHLVFQLAKLASSLLRMIRAELGQSPWDVLVTGQARGRLHAVETIDTSLTGPRILLLEHATGDEELPAGVAGILLAHDLPHLSHLGVRARQAGVVVACCEEAELFHDLRELGGQMLRLTASIDGIHLEPAEESGVCPSTRVAGTGALPPVRLDPPAPVLPLEEIEADRGGNKSHGARKLSK
uniref:phosphohistidine-like domain-containing protein n=1 Tax=Luteolibacter marinus TaxID=2776705 RepID=UPI001867337A